MIRKKLRSAVLIICTITLWITMVSISSAAEKQQVNYREIVDPPQNVTASYFDEEHSMVEIAWVEPDSSDIDHYLLYRLLEGEENTPELWVLLNDQITDTIYYDDRNGIEIGRYKYSVRSSKDSNISEPAFSNIIEKGYQANINMLLGYNPVFGIDCILENRDNDPKHVYRYSTGSYGMELITFYDVWQGMYDLRIIIPGFNPYSLLGFGINNDITLNISTSSYLPPNDLKIDKNTMEMSWLPAILNYEKIFAEDFESGEIPVSWDQELIEDTLLWSTGFGSPSGIPNYSFYGTHNASLFGENGITRLTTPSLNLQNAMLPRISFWYTQAGDSLNQYDKLSVSFRKDLNGEWYDETSSSLPANQWRSGMKNIESPTNQINIGFKGDLSYPGGNGICLDEVTVFGAYYDANTDPVLGYNAFIDGVLLGFYPEAGQYPLPDLLPGLHVLGVQSVYSGGTSTSIEYPFYNYPCTYFNQPQNFSGFINGMTAIFSWEPPENLSKLASGKMELIKKITETDSLARFELQGYYIWNFDEIVAYVPDSVYQYVDTLSTVCDSSLEIVYEYNITALYGYGESCKLDIPFIIVSTGGAGPQNVSASIIDGDSVFISWNPSLNPSAIGYNIYRNRQQIAFTADTSYTESIINIGQWDYEVTSVYTSGSESCFAGPAAIHYMMNGFKGIVIDATNHDRLSGVNLLLTPGNFTALSNEEGEFLFNDIPAGSYEALLTYPGYYSKELDVEVHSLGFVRETILLADSSLSEMPFTEPWDDGSFVNQNWSFDTIQGLWRIDEDNGNPLPCASFSGSDQLLDYSCTLYSNIIDATEATGNAFLNFDLNIGAGQLTGTEFLKIELWNGKKWDSCSAFSNLADTGWIHCNYDVSNIVIGHTTQIKFTAFGDDSDNIDHWQIDNIVLEKDVMGSLSGIVTCTSGEQLEGIRIQIEDQEVVTDKNGAYFLNLLAGNKTIRINADGYNAYENSIHVYGDVDLDIELNQPIIELDPLSIYVAINGWYKTEYLEISNNGSGGASWNAWIEYEDQQKPDLKTNTSLRNKIPGNLSAVDLSPMATEISGSDSRNTWDLLFEHDITKASSGISGQSGIEFTESSYYVTQWNEDRINKYDINGEFLGSFEIQGASGIRDLTWDGEYLYGGSVSPWFYQINPDDLTVSMIVTTPVYVRGIAYDKQADAFWVCDWNTDIYLVDRQGITIDTIVNPGIENIYGIVYDNLSGPPSLWLFIQGDPGATLVQIDIGTSLLTGQTKDVLADVSVSGYSVAGGAFLSTEVVPGVVTLGGLIQAENNIIFGYELEPSFWLSLEKYTGYLDAGESEIIEVRFNGKDIFWGEEYEAKIRFTSNPDVPVEEVDVAFVLVGDIEDFASDTGLVVFPNPAHEQLFIEVSDQISEIRIYDNTGKLMFQQKLNKSGSITINTKDYKTGVYLIEAITKHQNHIVKKIVIWGQ